MRVLKRLELIDQIGRELQSRMTYSDIDVYLTAHGVDCKDFEPSTNSKWVYVKELLVSATEELVLTIAGELELEHGFSSVTPKEATFWRSGQFRLFLSHLASFKIGTARLQHGLKKYAISAFVAHEDIEPSREWQMEIEAALHTMDAMAALLMPGFEQSKWCDQEVGFAVGKNVLVIPVRKGLDPYGFIGKYQAIQGNNKKVNEVSKELFEVLATSPKTKGKMIRAVSNQISLSTESSEAQDSLGLLSSFPEISEEMLESLKASVSENSVLMQSTNFLNAFNLLLSDHNQSPLITGISTADDWDDDIPF